MNTPTPINDGGPAFPVISSGPGFDSYSNPFTRIQSEGGLSVRDWLAGQALIGVVSAVDADGCSSWLADRNEHLAAERAYQIADAMLAAREAKQ